MVIRYTIALYVKNLRKLKVYIFYLKKKKNYEFFVTYFLFKYSSARHVDSPDHWT